MESRLRNLLLACLSCVLFTFNTPLSASEENIDQVIEPIIKPEIKRFNFDESKIDSDNIEIISSAGILSIENFGVNPVISFQLTYRITEGFFVGAEYGSSKASESSIEKLLPGTSLLSGNEKDLKYYLLNVGYDVFPGETFITKNTTFNSAFYVIGGLGNTQFAGADNFTYNIGFGYRIVTSDYLTAYIDMRDHAFSIDLFGDNKLTHNLAIKFGIGFYF